MIEHISLEGLWSDFSNLTPLETCISSVEQIFRGWAKAPFLIEKKSFILKEREYKVAYIPANDDPVSDVLSDLQYTDYVAQSVPELFSIHGDFIVVYTNITIARSDYRTVMSIIAPALELSGLRVPVFLQKSREDPATFAGFFFGDGSVIEYTSRVENFLPDNLKSFSLIKRTIEKLLNDKVRYINVNSRFISCLNELDFNNGLRYNRNDFYSVKCKDPIKQMHVYLHFDTKPIDKLKINVLEPDHVSMFPIIRSLSEKKRESMLRSFISLVHEIWTYDSIENAMKDVEIQNINSLIDSLMATKPVNFRTSVRGASPHSSFANLCKEIVQRGTVEEMCLLWYNFLKRVKKAYKTNKPIRGIETTGVDCNQSIIYQKLQMINYCIANPDAGYISGEDTGMFLLDGKELIAPERQIMPTKTTDQFQREESILEEAEKTNDKETISFLQNRQMKSDMSAFKAANPTAVFADFVRWRIPHDYNQEKNELKDSINPEYVALWERTKPATARQQEEFFNTDKEIELALADLEMLKPGDLIQSIIPTLFASAIYDLTRNTPQFPYVSDKVEIAKRSLLSFSRRTSAGVKSMMEFSDLCMEPIEAIENASYSASIVESLLVKLPGCKSAVLSMLEDGCASFVKADMPAIKEFFKKTEFRGRQAATLRAREYVIVAETESSVKERLFISDRSERTIIASAISIPSTKH